MVAQFALDESRRNATPPVPLGRSITPHESSLRPVHFSEAQEEKQEREVHARSNAVRPALARATAHLDQKGVKVKVVVVLADVNPDGGTFPVATVVISGGGAS